MISTLPGSESSRRHWMNSIKDEFAGTHGQVCLNGRCRISTGGRTLPELTDDAQLLKR